MRGTGRRLFRNLSARSSCLRAQEGRRIPAVMRGCRMTGAAGLHLRMFGTGPRPVLALHCSLAHGGAWTAVAARLPGCRLLAPDLPGHGLSPDWAGPGDYHDATTRAVGSLLGALAQDGPVDLLGHSFGATVALRLALQRPELVRSLMLVEPVLFAAARAAGAPEYLPWQAQAAPYRAAMAEGRTERKRRPQPIELICS